jgi:hypothetical protein
VNSTVLKSTFPPSRLCCGSMLLPFSPAPESAALGFWRAETGSGNQKNWQGKKDSNLRMSESKSDALTNLATPLHRLADLDEPDLQATNFL